MGSFLTNRDAYQALIIPQDRWVTWDAESSATPEGGRASIASSSELQIVPVELGTGAPAQALTLTCERSGMPAPADSLHPAAFTVENQSTSQRFGLDESYHLTGVSSTIQASTTLYKGVSLCTTSQERLVITATSQSSNNVHVWYQDNDRKKSVGPVTGAAVTAAGTTELTAFAYGDGLARIIYSDVIVSGSTYPFRLGTMTLDGSTVTVDSDQAVDDMRYNISSPSIAGDISKISGIAAAARGDEVLLLVAVNYHSTSTYRTNARSTLRQYASTDGGLSFRFIGELEDSAATDAVVHPVIMVTDAGYTVAYHKWDGTQAQIYVRNIGSAYAPLLNAAALFASNITGAPRPAAASISSGVLTVNERLAGWIDHRGYMFAVSGPDYLIRSTDNGITWSHVGTWAYQDSEDEVQPWSATFHRAHAVIAVDRTSTGASTDETVSLLSLGGWTNRTHPAAADGAPDIERPKWSQVYIPAGTVQRLNGVSRTATSMPQSATQGVNRFTAGANEARIDILIDIDAGTGTAAAFEPAVFEASGTTEQGITTGGLLVNEFPMTYQLDITDGSARWYGMRVGVQSGELKVYEQTTPTTQTLINTVTLTQDRVDVRICISGGRGRALYREYSSTNEGRATPGIRQWTHAHANQHTLSNAWGSGAPTASRARIISRMDNGETSDLNYFAVRGDRNTAYNINAIIEGNSTQRPAEYGYRPLYLAGDVVVRALGGVAAQGDEHAITAAYDRGLDQMLNDDVRRGFKETDSATGDLVLAWQLEDGAECRQPGGVIAIALIGSNITGVVPSIYSGGAWDDFSTTDLTVGGFSLHWNRQGKTVVASDAGSVDLLVRESEFNGCTWSTGLDGAVIAETVGGQWDESTYPPQLRLEETHTGASGTGGGIIPSTVVLLLFVGATPVEGVRLTVNGSLNRAAAGSALKIDQAVIGRLLPHWQPASWGRVVALELGAETTELRDRSSRRVVNAQPQRVVDVAWADGIDTREASEDSDNPDLVDVFSQNSAQAAKGATAWEIYGTLQQLNGDRPVVYLPRVNVVSGPTVQVLNRRDLVVHGRLEGDPRMETIVGEEYTGEVLRGLGFTIREIV